MDYFEDAFVLVFIAIVGILMLCAIVISAEDNSSDWENRNLDPNVGIVWDNQNQRDYHVCKDGDLHWTWNDYSRSEDHEIEENASECN